MLKEKLTSDLKDALRAGDSKRRTVIGMLLSVVKNRELEKRAKLSKSGAPVSEQDIQLSDKEIVEAVASEVKKRKEAITTYEQGGRPELAQGEQEELALLMQYMPEQLSDDAIREQVRSVIAEVHPSGMQDMGKVIGAVMPRVKGKADGQKVSALVKEELAKL